MDELKKLELELRLCVSNAHYLLNELHRELERARAIRKALEDKLNHEKRNDEK